MTTSVTERYVAATARHVEESQRADLEQELRATIEDMIGGRLQAGTPDRDTAEREVLVELGDPIRLAASYSGRPLHLLGPAVYPAWRRLVILLLATVVPLAGAVAIAARARTTTAAVLVIAVWSSLDGVVKARREAVRQPKAS